MGVLKLLLVLLLVWFILIVVLAAWTLFYQGYVYTEPTTGVPWRAPAAGSAVMLPLLVWVVLDYRSPGRYRTLFEFSPVEVRDFDELVVEVGKNRDTYRKAHNERGKLDYRNVNPNRPKQLPSRPDRVIVTEDGKESVFEPERDAKGNFQPRPNQPLRYLDAGKRVMVEGQLGRVETFYVGRLLLNLFLNFALLLAWFLSLWLLLRFGWPMALLQAVLFWGGMLLFVLPPVLTRAEEVARARDPTKATTSAPAPARGLHQASARSNSPRYQLGSRSRRAAARAASASASAGSSMRRSSRQRFTRHSASAAR
jgi:hypothetical protein